MRSGPLAPMLPWWAKIAAKIMLARLPVMPSTWQRLGLFRHGAMDDPDYSIGVFRSHTRSAGLERLKGLRILELGPGNSAATAVVAAAHGASAVLVDAGNFAADNVAFYARLADRLQKQGLPVPALADCTTVSEVLERCGAQFHADGLEGLRRIPSSSVDLVFSQAVLEHIRAAEFAATMAELGRILRPGAASSHRVDLRDHLGGALNNLRFSPAIWESQLFTRSGFYTNRMSLHQMQDVFQQTHDAVAITGMDYWHELPIKERQMHRSFRTMTETERLVQGFHVLMRKNAEPGES